MTMERFKEEFEFLARVAEAGFDIEHLMDTKPPSCLLSTCKCKNNDDYPDNIVLYARMGIHSYNMTQGTNLQFSCIEKYNYRPKIVYTAYYITLVAKDSAAGGSLVVFQTRVVVEGFQIKKLTCNLARPKPGPQENLVQRQPLVSEPVDDFYKGTLPEWPSSENVFYDKKRFYVVKKSEVRKYDWIRLYMELAFLTANRKLKNPNLSKLVIVKVAIETKENVEPPSERIKARNAIFYIKYKYHPNKGRAPKVRAPKVHCHNPPRDRIAIVRRTMDKSMGLLTLLFEESNTKEYRNDFTLIEQVLGLLVEQVRPPSLREETGNLLLR